MHWKKLLIFGVLTGAAICAVRYHSTVSLGILDAGSRCVYVIIPSLYLFSILAALFVRTGALSCMGERIHPLSRRVPGMDGSLLMVLLFSQLGGYPVGAQLLHQLRRDKVLTAAQERSLLCACVGCGPAFLLGTVCSHMPPRLTCLLFLSIVLPNLVLGWIVTKCSRISVSGTASPGVSLNAEKLVSAVESGASAMVRICSMILLFGAGMGVMQGMGLLLSQENREGRFLSAVLEISCITDYISGGGSLPMAAALLSFGGICVHLQIAAICDGNLAWLQFWLCRITAAVTSYGLCFWGIRLLYRGQVPAGLVSPSPFNAVPANGNHAAVLCLLLMSVMLLIRWERVLSGRHSGRDA